MRAAYRLPTRLFLLTPLACALALSACDDRPMGPSTTVIITPVATGNTFAISNATGNVLSFDRSGATAVRSNLRVQGLSSTESIVGIDVRSNSLNSADSAGVFKLYALVTTTDNVGAVYRLDPTTGFVSSRVALRNCATGSSTCTATATAYSTLAGTNFGTDFNPMPDRLRVVSDTGQNLRINVDTGEVNVDTPITAGTGATSINPSAVAYTNATASTASAPSTTLYYIDATTNRLLTTTAPNGGVVTEVGALGVDVTAINGFDIDGTDTNKAYAVMSVGTKLSLYTINLTSGAATAVSEFCGAGGTMGTAPNVTCVNPANDSFKGLALKI